jgi:hypothetical protein
MYYNIIMSKGENKTKEDEMEHTQGKVTMPTGWHGETSVAGIDHEGAKDLYNGFSHARHEDEEKDFYIRICADGKSQTDAGEQAQIDVARVATLWNAADGMTTEQAVKYLEHGAEMGTLLKRLCNGCPVKFDNRPDVCSCMVGSLLKKLEGK